MYVLCVAFFALHCIFVSHSYYCRQLATVDFHCCVVIHCMVSPQLKVSSIDSDLSLAWCFLKNAAMSTLVYELLVHRCMSFSEVVVFKGWLLHLPPHHLGIL